MVKLPRHYAEAALRDWDDAPAFDEPLRNALLEIAARTAAAVLADVSRATPMTLEQARDVLGAVG